VLVTFVRFAIDLSTAFLYYSFDSSTVSGATVQNLGTGGSAYDATMVSSPTISTADVVVGTGSIQFSGSSQYVTIPSFATGSTGLSFAFWFKFNSGCVANCRIFDFSNGAPSDNLLMGSNLNDCYLDSYLGLSDNGKLYSCNLNVNDGLWRHFVWVIHSNGDWAVYVNGALTNYYTGIQYPNTVTRSQNYLGRSDWWSPSPDPYLNGAIDEFYLFYSVLSATQVLGLYHQGDIFKNS